MEIKSIGLKTNVFMSSLLGNVYDRGDYIAIKTPSNPKFHWGNFLIFPSPPKNGDYASWLSLYDLEFKDIPNLECKLFTWDGLTGERGRIEKFVTNGFNIDIGVYLAAQATIPPKHLNTNIEIRVIQNNSDWNQLLNIHKNESHLHTQLLQQRKWTEKGRGHLFGAFYQDKLVGDLGLFNKDGIGRFQNVGTIEEFRKQGVCGTLVYEVSKRAFSNLGIKQLIMEADNESGASRIYESLGFKEIEKNIAISCFKK